MFRDRVQPGDVPLSLADHHRRFFSLGLSGAAKVRRVESEESQDQYVRNDSREPDQEEVV